MLKDLSAGNLKFLIANVFNILHSPFLPLNLLFSRVLYNDQRRKNLFALPHLYSCLMAVRYPYFSSSLILNVFNADDGRDEDDFQNVLVILRLLFFIQFKEEVTLENIKNEFENIGYHINYVNAALEKMYGLGLLDSDSGALLRHLTGESKMRLSISGQNYLEHSFFKFTYLNFVADDTPMDQDLLVKVTDKYIMPKEEKINMEEKMSNRRKSVIYFIIFIERNEKLEREKLGLKGKKLTQFLNKFSPKINRVGVPITEFIWKKTPIKERIEVPFSSTNF